MSVPLSTSAKDNNSSFEYTAPVGLDGVFKSKIFVLSVIAAFNCSAVILNSVESSVSINTGTPSENFTCSG